MGALGGLEPRSSGLDGQHPHTMPPRLAMLRWPNRDVSMGSLTGTLASGLTFHPSSIDGPLAARKGIFANINFEELSEKFLQDPDCSPFPDLTEISLRGIEVVPSPETEVGELPWVRPKLLETVPGVPQNVLTDLADVASGICAPTLVNQRRLPAVLSAALSSTEDPVAVRRAREALDRNSNAISMNQMLELSNGAPGRYRLSTSDTADVDNHQMLQSLDEGEHLLLSVGQWDAQGTAHALAISATRLEEGNVRLSVFNSNGWTKSDGNGSAPHSPAVFKTMSITDAVAALRTLDEMGLAPAVDLPRPWLERWGDSSEGTPLLSWLRNAGPRDAMPLLSEQRMTPQKSVDCSIEVQFAWLASVLPPADYKLAKAHTLNVLAQAAETTGRSELELERLQDRITTSLSGYAVSPSQEGVARTPNVAL